MTYCPYQQLGEELCPWPVIERIVSWNMGAIDRGSCHANVRLGLADIVSRAHQAAVFDRTGAWIARSDVELAALAAYAEPLEVYGAYIADKKKGIPTAAPQAVAPRAFVPNAGAALNRLVVEDATGTYVPGPSHLVREFKTKGTRCVAVRKT